jgi:hypothetical protein
VVVGRARALGLVPPADAPVRYQAIGAASQFKTVTADATRGQSSEDR